MKKILTNRIVSQDIAKGIAIILVILTHTVQVTKPVGTIFAVLLGYIMPFFLFMAGYNYNDKGLSIKENLKRRTWQIVKPFLLYSFIIFVIMGCYFLLRGEATIYELGRSYFVLLISKWGAKLIGINLPQVLYQRLLGPCWFLQFLVVANFFFIPFAKWVLDNNKRLFSSVILLSGISVLLICFNVSLPWGIQNGPEIAGLMLLANYFKKINLFYNPESHWGWTILNCFICLLTIGLFQLKANGAGFLGAGELGAAMGGAEVYVMYIMAITGSYFLINVSKLIEKANVPGKILSWYGRNSLLILVIHISIMHIIKDIMGLEQRNAAESLFGSSINPLEFVAFIITMIFVTLFVMAYNKYKLRKA